MIIHMLSYNTVHKRGVIHIPILCKIATAKYMFKTTKHLTIQNKQIDILSHSTQTSHVTEWRIFIYTVLFSKSPKLRYFHNHMVTI